jgi:CBS domain-containing protein
VSREALNDWAGLPQRESVLGGASPIMRGGPGDNSLNAYTDTSPFTVPSTFCAQRAYMMMTQIGLRHIVVLEGLKPVGVLTRKDILPYESAARRMNAVSMQVDIGDSAGSGLISDLGLSDSIERADRRRRRLVSPGRPRPMPLSARAVERSIHSFDGHSEAPLSPLSASEDQPGA